MFLRAFCFLCISQLRGAFHSPPRIECANYTLKHRLLYKDRRGCCTANDSRDMCTRVFCVCVLYARCLRPWLKCVYNGRAENGRHKQTQPNTLPEIRQDGFTRQSPNCIEYIKVTCIGEMIHFIPTLSL